MPLTAREVSQDFGPALESITMTTGQLQDLVISLILKCLDKLGIAVSPDTVAEAVAAHQLREPEPVRPVALNPADPSLVATFVLRPIHERGIDYAPGACLYATPDRAARLAELGLVSLDAAEVPPAPPAAGPKASALSMQGAPGGLIRSGR
jgi:hypothetical protein